MSHSFMLVLLIIEKFVAAPARYPDLYPVINAVFSCVHFCLFFGYFTARQLGWFSEIGGSTEKKKK